MTMRANWITLLPDQQAELDEHFGNEGWRVISPSELPSAFPADLRNKVGSAVAITAETTTGGTYYVISAWRLDRKWHAFDNEPFGLIVHSSGASSQAVIVHHGEWEGRTEPIPAGLVDLIEEEGVGDYLWAVPPVGKRAGTLVELPKPHSGAFRAIVREIRARIDQGKTGPA